MLISLQCTSVCTLMKRAVPCNLIPNELAEAKPACSTRRCSFSLRLWHMALRLRTRLAGNVGSDGGAFCCLLARRNAQEQFATGADIRIPCSRCGGFLFPGQFSRAPAPPSHLPLPPCRP